METISDGFLCQGTDPESLDRAFGASKLHHPTLDEFSFLSGITAVNDLSSLFIKGLDNLELLLVYWCVNELDLKLIRNHRETRKLPFLPYVLVVLRGFEHTQVTEGPGNLIAVTLKIAVLSLACTENLGYLQRHTGLFCDTYYHNAVALYSKILFRRSLPFKYIPWSE